MTIDTAVPTYNPYGDERQPQTAQTLGRNGGAVTSTRVGRFLYTVQIFFDGIFWAKIDAETNTGVQGGYIGDSNHVYFDPAISANDAGAVVIAYGRSGPQEFGSAYASVGTLDADGRLSFDPPLLLRAGFEIYDDTATPTGFGGARWSDYSTAVSVDPLDARRFWISAAYVSGRNRASTHVTQLAITRTAAGTTLANLSTRLRVETGDDVLIGGFIVTGTQSKELIVRATGPSLAVADRLANPTLQLTDGDGNVVEFNDDWQQSPNKQVIIDSTIAPADDLESAVAGAVAPGAYTQ